MESLIDGGGLSVVGGSMREIMSSRSGEMLRGGTAVAVAYSSWSEGCRWLRGPEWRAQIFEYVACEW